MTASTDTAARPRYLYVDEVAEELRRTSKAVRYLIDAGQLKAGKVGGRVVVRPDDLDAFIASGFES